MRHGREPARRTLAALSPPVAFVVAVSLGYLTYVAFTEGQLWLGGLGCLGTLLILFEGWQNRKSGRDRRPPPGNVR